jgi:hypothetical protein
MGLIISLFQSLEVCAHCTQGSLRSPWAMTLRPFRPEYELGIRPENRMESLVPFGLPETAGFAELKK